MTEIFCLKLDYLVFIPGRLKTQEYEILSFTYNE